MFDSEFKYQRIHTFSLCFSICLVSIYFLFPKSFTVIVPGDFREFNTYLKPWFFQRYLAMFCCLAYIFSMLVIKRFVLSKLSLISLLLILICCLVAAFYEQIVFLYGLSGVFAAYVFYKDVSSSRLDFSRAIVILLVFCLICYVLQFVVFRAGSRVTSSFLDPNISGYYLLLCYSVFRCRSYRFLSLLALSLGVLSLSRNFYLAVIVFEFVMLLNRKGKLQKMIIVSSPFFMALLSIIIMLLFSYLMIGFSSISTTIGDSSARLLNVTDGSNFARALANVDMLKRLFSGEFIFVGNGNEVDLNTEIRPHNAFLRSIYRYGIVLSSLMICVSLYLMRLTSIRAYPLFVSVFTYYTLLNDFITGPDIGLLLVISVLCSPNVSFRNCSI